MGWSLAGTLAGTSPELAYAENNTAQATACTGSGNYIQIPGTGIVVPATSGPVYVEYEATIRATTNGNGVVASVLMEIPAGGGNPTALHSATRSASPPGTYNASNGSPLLGNVRGLKRLGPTTANRQFVLAITQIPDQSSSLAIQADNTAINPSWIGAYVQ